MTTTEIVASTTEQEDFARLDAVVRRGLGTFIEVGKALAEISSRKLYRENYETFAAYLAHEHSLSTSRGYQLISAAEIAAEMSTVVDKPPANESQCRELLAYADADRQEIWQQALEQSESTGKPITARLIRDIGKPYRGPVETEPKEPDDGRFTTLVEATHAMSEAFERIAERWPKGSYSVLADQLGGSAIRVRRRIEDGHYGDILQMEDAAEPEKPRSAGQSRGIGIQQAHEAIERLKRIPQGDLLRDRAFEIVADYIEHNHGGDVAEFVELEVEPAPPAPDFDLMTATSVAMRQVRQAFHHWPEVYRGFEVPEVLRDLLSEDFKTW